MNADPAEKLANMPQGTGFFIRESDGAAGKRKYSIFIPRDYKNDGTKWPTIVFLHGVGEAGNDGKGCRTVGIGPAIADRGGKFDFIVIFPQTGWDWTGQGSENAMLDALKDAQKHYNIDADRISLTGMSSGGKGTWVLGARHPEIFSALVPMGGFSAVEEAPRLTRIPIWALHNSGDGIVGVGNTEEMLRKIREAGGNPRESIYPDSGHNCWDRAYNEGALFAWLKAQRRAGGTALGK
jgi:predicted peptidase